MPFLSVSVAAEFESTWLFAANSGSPSGQQLGCSLKAAKALTVVADAGGFAAGNAAVVFAEGDEAGFAAAATAASVGYLKETVTFAAAAAAAAGAKKYLTALVGQLVDFDDFPCSLED